MTKFTLSLILFTIVFSSCHINGGRRITGNGTVTTQQRNISSFTGIRVGSSMKVFISQGTEHSIKVEADENLMEYIEIKKNGNTLEIDNKDGYNLKPKHTIKIHITAPEFYELSVAGSGGIKSKTKISTRDLKINIGGSGDVDVEVDAPEVTATIGGSGSISLRGTTRSLSTHIGGSGEVHAFQLLSEKASVNIGGSGDAEVFASKQLEISIAGSGDVAYKGTPAVNQRIAGSGDVRKIN